jgi:hypothetical protein
VFEVAASRDKTQQRRWRELVKPRMSEERRRKRETKKINEKESQPGILDPFSIAPPLRVHARIPID